MFKHNFYWIDEKKKDKENHTLKGKTVKMQPNSTYTNFPFL